MARNMSSGIDISIHRKTASDLLSRLQPFGQGAAFKQDDYLVRSQKAVQDMLQRWAEQGRTATKDVENLHLIMRDILGKNLQKFGEGVSNADKEFRDIARTGRHLGDAMQHAEESLTKLTTGAGGAEKAAAGGRGLGVIGGVIGFLGAAALFAGFEGLKTAANAATEEQARQQQLALIGPRAGSFRGLVNLTNTLNSNFGMDPTQASQFAMSMLRGGISGIGDLSQRANIGAGVTRMLGMSNEEGAGVFGTLGRAGLDKQKWEEIGSIIGEALEKARQRGREPETMDSLSKSLEGISRYFLMSREGKEFSDLSLSYARSTARLTGTGLAGLQGAAGIQFQEQFAGGVRSNGFQIPNMGQALTQLSLLNTTGGSLSKMIHDTTFSTPGEKNISLMQSGLKTLLGMFGGDADDKNPTHRSLVEAGASQFLGRAVPYEDIKSLANMTQTDAKGQIDAWDKKAKAESVEGIVESNTKALTDLSQSLSHLGDRLQPELGKLIIVGEKLTKDIESVIGPTEKTVSNARKIYDHGVWQTTKDTFNEGRETYNKEHDPNFIGPIRPRPYSELPMPEGADLVDITNAVKNIVNFIMTKISATPPIPPGYSLR